MSRLEKIACGDFFANQLRSRRAKSVVFAACLSA